MENRWQLLDHVHKGHADKAAAKVVGQRAIVFAEVNKLEQLKDYSNEYACDQNKLKSTSLLLNSRNFFAKLAQAIEHQENVLNAQKRNLEKLEQAWFEAVKRQKSYQALVEHSEKLMHIEADKKEQKQLDEWSNGRFNHHKDLE